ncbi:hypothetical protein [Halorarius litoreus]|uniref:hypothetical protein n=1 Tax=Halorarius litoreus TaxID=2962676 RepID=UPI0020CD2A5B|nr:hypothetical protein [Halorarius litoreus]
MNSRRRDGLLATGALALLLVLAWAAGATRALTRVGPAVVGVGGSLLLEAVFLRYPDRTHELWERPLVQAVAFALVAGIGILAIQSGLGWALAALAWGLVAYLLLLAIVVSTGENPLATVVGR